ncbi:MAG: hypothetical protein HUK24_06955, partial [Sphaerochaetaceae bacterium]|nr:hypothetical protein [Sphaerochaetaceae bacterium]
MKHITLLHTVPSVYNSYPQLLKKAFEPEEIEVTSILDEFLVTNAKKKGFFPPENKRKLFLDLLSAQEENPDIIIVTCSSLTPFVGDLMDTFTTPIVRIDTNMCKTAAMVGKKIAVLATAPTTVEPTVSLVKSFALENNKTIEIEAFLNEEAMDELKLGHVDKHDEILGKLAREKCQDFDVVILA